jgi:alcohol dehydrogenase, propanol-preferring
MEDVLMQAMVLDSPGPIDEAPLKLRTRPLPSPAADEVLLRVEACAVCRTDLQLVEGELTPRMQGVVPGHQVVGIVETAGDNVSGWQSGDRAGVAWLAQTCGVCRYCSSGRENLCLEAKFTGWDRDGGYAEYATVRADFALRLPPGLDPVAAAPLLCGGVIGYRALERSGIQPGGRLGLFGYGASAHLALQVARHWGCAVYVFTRSQREQARALATGADWAGNYDAVPAVTLDAAITFAPAGDVVLAALRTVVRGGAVAINAIHLDRIPQFSYDLLWWERELRSVANFTRQDAREFLRLAPEVPVRTEAQTFPLVSANQALQSLKRGNLTGTAVLVTDEGTETQTALHGSRRG